MGESNLGAGVCKYEDDPEVLELQEVDFEIEDAAEEGSVLVVLEVLDEGGFDEDEVLCEDD
jgi:hypothetical protein